MWGVFSKGDREKKAAEEATSKFLAEKYLREQAEVAAETEKEVLLALRSAAAAQSASESAQRAELHARNAEEFSEKAFAASSITEVAYFKASNSLPKQKDAVRHPEEPKIVEGMDGDGDAMSVVRGIPDIEQIVKLHALKEPESVVLAETKEGIPSQPNGSHALQVEPSSEHNSPVEGMESVRVFLPCEIDQGVASSKIEQLSHQEAIPLDSSETSTASAPIVDPDILQQRQDIERLKQDIALLKQQQEEDERKMRDEEGAAAGQSHLLDASSVDVVKNHEDLPLHNDGVQQPQQEICQKLEDEELIKVDEEQTQRAEKPRWAEEEQARKVQEEEKIKQEEAQKETLRKEQEATTRKEQEERALLHQRAGTSLIVETPPVAKLSRSGRKPPPPPPKPASLTSPPPKSPPAPSLSFSSPLPSLVLSPAPPQPSSNLTRNNSTTCMPETSVVLPNSQPISVEKLESPASPHSPPPPPPVGVSEVPKGTTASIISSVIDADHTENAIVPAEQPIHNEQCSELASTAERDGGTPSTKEPFVLSTDEQTIEPTSGTNGVTSEVSENNNCGNVNDVSNNKINEETTAVVSSESKSPPLVSPLADFEILKVVGKGRFAKVVLARRLADDAKFAIKIMEKAFLIQQNQVANVMSERRVLEQLHHPFLMSLCFAFETADKLYLGLDFVEGGELFFHGQLQPKRRFSEEAVRLWAAELTLALGHLHSVNTVFRDLKPENVLLDLEGHVHLTDFGLAKDLNGPGGKTQTFCGAKEYLAPEVIQGLPYGFSVDWWTLGILIYELTVGLPPFFSRNTTEMYAKILHADLRFPPFLSPECVHLVRLLLERDPAQRLGSRKDVEELQSHPFFAQGHSGAELQKYWDDVYRKAIPSSFRPTENNNGHQQFEGEKVEDLSEAVSDENDRSFAGFDFQLLY